VSEKDRADAGQKAHVCGQGIVHDEKAAAVEKVEEWAGGGDGSDILGLQPRSQLANHARKFPGKRDGLQALAKCKVSPR